jgi:hypothetical protein
VSTRHWLIEAWNRGSVYIADHTFYKAACSVCCLVLVVHTTNTVYTTVAYISVLRCQKVLTVTVHSKQVQSMLQFMISHFLLSVGAFTKSFCYFSKATWTYRVMKENFPLKLWSRGLIVFYVCIFCKPKKGICHWIWREKNV